MLSIFYSVIFYSIVESGSLQPLKTPSNRLRLSPKPLKKISLPPNCNLCGQRIFTFYDNNVQNFLVIDPWKKSKNRNKKTTVAPTTITAKNHYDIFTTSSLYPLTATHYRVKPATMINLPRPNRITLTCIVLAISVFILTAVSNSEDEIKSAEIPPPVLSVVLIRAHEEQLAQRVPASGNVVAWQEAIISAESDGLKLIEVKVNVGDSVKRGQILARFNADIVEAELAEAVATVAQAEATALEAELNFTRAKILQMSKAISTQQFDQQKVAVMTTRAQVDAAKAIAKKNRLRLNQTSVFAPSDGIITSRTATIGTVVPSAQELFRVLENGRLEWRAVVATPHMKNLVPGQNVVIATQDHPVINGTLRTIAPTVNTSTHTGLVYVDLPAQISLRAGTFVRGYIEVGDALALTLPQRAIILRDGFHYVMQADSNSIVSLKKITVGRQIDDRVEIISGLGTSELVIASGLGFLSEGDIVKVVNPLHDAPFSMKRSESTLRNESLSLSKD